MIKLSNIFDNIDEFSKRIKSSNLFEENKQFILDILNTSYKISNIKYWKDLYKYILERFCKELLIDSNNKYLINIFDYSEDELNLIKNYISESKENKNNFIKLSINKIFKDNDFKNLLNSFDKYNIEKLFNLEIEEYKTSQKTFYTYIVNKHKIAEYKVGMDYYSTKNSNIRSLYKRATDLQYDKTGIKYVMNSLFNLNDDNYQDFYNFNTIERIFKNDFHDVNWGYTGPKRPTNQSILEKLQELYMYIENEYTK
jgi:hypothetical protein|nr:MAG TPA: hypothetical protein [Caudoviricetes sp.]